MNHREFNRNHPAFSYIISCDYDVALYFDETGETKWYLRQILASKSAHLDRLLSVDAHDSTDEYNKVTLYRITGDVFDCMMKHVSDPCAARSMTKAFAKELIPFYDEYEMKDGIKLCDHVLHDYTKILHQATTGMFENGFGNFDPDYTLKVNECIEIAQLSKKHDLPMTLELGKLWITDRLIRDRRLLEQDEDFFFALDITQTIEIVKVLFSDQEWELVAPAIGNVYIQTP